MNPLPESILANLADADPIKRLGAVSALRALPAGLPELLALARLAANDPDPAVRSAAMAALRSEEAQVVFSNQTLPRDTRAAMFEQIDRWQIDGQITREQAEVLRLRYHFERKPALLSEAVRAQLSELIRRWKEQALISAEQANHMTSSLSAADGEPAPAAPEPKPGAAKSAAAAKPDAATVVEQAAIPAPAPAKPERASAPAPSLSQILFSETSIRIALFLGGFLVVAAALILAALVEVARLPVLLGLMSVSGAGALIARRRLPLPSYVLYIIFASLLPILARVLADLLKLHGSVWDAYWSAAWLMLALALALGTRLYASRLMSFVSLGALVAAGYKFSTLLTGEWASMGLILGLIAVIGALAVMALQRWKDSHFALPLYLGAHLVALAGLVITAARIALELFNLSPTRAAARNPVDWLFFASAWAAAALFYILADRFVRRFALLPYLAAGALLLLPWTAAEGFAPGAIILAAVIAAWGVLYALLGAGLDSLTQDADAARDFLRRDFSRRDFPRRYGKPLMFGAPVLFLWAAVLGLDEDLYAGLALLLVAAAVMTLLNVLRSRRWAWSVALLFLLLAYFVFFELPALNRLNLTEPYVALVPGLLLLVPEFLPFSAKANARWRVPARWIGAIWLSLLAFAAFTLAFTSSASDQQEGAVVYAVMAVFFLALAVWRRLPWIAIVTTVLLPSALVLLLLSLSAARWLPWLAGMAVLFYALGWLLRRAPGLWSGVFRFSALGLGLLLVLRLPFEHDWIGGLSVLAAAVLFLVELLRGPRSKASGWLEIPLDAVLLGALFGLLNPVYRQDASLAWALGLLLAALIVLGLDLFLSRTATGRQVSGPALLRWAVRGAGILLALASLTFNIASDGLPAGWVALIFAISAGYALLSARAYPLPHLGYALVGYLALALFYLLRAFHLNIWLAPEIALAVLFYAMSFLVRGVGSRAVDGQAHAASTWAEVLRYGGLALALFVSLTAPLEDSGLWASLWVASAATLYAVEAFRRRSVWWGFPTDGLYLLAYFLLLLELHVDQPQYFSIAIAALGMLQHYLLIRTGSSLGAFITGMVSQLVLLGTTYSQMVSTEQLGYFVILFFQGLAVLVYGILLRSRSLVITPLVFIVLGVMTVVLSILSGVPTAIIIGCTGILLLTLGILAVILRERLVEASEKIGGWRA